MVRMESLQAQLLVATPQLVDPNFLRTVVLIVRHSEEGAMGVVINRRARLSVREVWTKVSDSECATEESLHVGGPCPGPLMALHGSIEHADFEVLPGLYFTAEPESISQLVATTHGEVRFFAGYAGWGPGQLENEIASGAWLVAPAKSELIFDANDAIWDSLMAGAPRATSWLIDALSIKHVPPAPWLN